MSLSFIDFIRANKPIAKMPSGAIGIWYADRYDSATNSIPNSITSPAPSLNIIRGSRRLFSNVLFWKSTGAGVGVVRTDMAAVAPDGTTSASTIVAPGAWWVMTESAQSIPAGTYTIVVAVKSNDASNQQFIFTTDAGLTFSSIATATTSWQILSYTFTNSVAKPLSAFRIYSFDGATGVNLQLDSFELYEGSVDLGMSVSDTNLYLGITRLTLNPTVVANEITYAANGTGVIAIPLTAATSITAMAVISKVSVPSAYDSFLSSATAYTEFTAAIDISLKPATVIGGSTTYANIVSFWQLLNQGYHMITQRSDGAEHQLWIDDILLFRATKVAASVNLRDLFAGIVSAFTLYPGSKINSIALYPRALTFDEIRTSYASLSYKAASNGLTMGKARVLYQEGDSIIAASTTPLSYSYRYSANALPKVVGNNIAISGSTMTNANARAISYHLDDIPPPRKRDRRFILTLSITNGVDTTTYMDALVAYADARRAAGWYVVLMTLLPRSTAGYEAIRNANNAEIRTWATGGTLYPGIHADAIVDFANETIMDNVATTADTTYYSDGVHPTDAGHILLEVVYRNVINAIPA
jgi:hypothetical protein